MKDDFKDSLTIEVKGSYDVAEIITLMFLYKVENL